MTTKLMTTNKRVQFYITYSTDKPTTALKKQRLTIFEESLEQRNIMLDELFPVKQLKVLDYILYICSGTGIAKVGAEHIANKCGVSVTTVYNAIRSLKQTDEFIVARLIKSGGGAGKYVLVDKKHANFHEIMQEVFMLSEASIKELFLEQFVEQQNVTNIDTTTINDKKQSPNYSSLLKSKQENNNYMSISSESSDEKEAIKESIENENDNSIEYMKLYASNPCQIALYEFIEQMPYSSIIKSNRAVIGLRVGSDCDMKRLNIAKKVIHSIAMRIAEGFVFENVVATFSAALEKAMKYGKVEDKTILNNVKPGLSDERSAAAVPFYNWLEERE